jgi:hypothetical protein
MKSFQQYLFESADKSEIDSALKDPNYVLGAEFEFYADSRKGQKEKTWINADTEQLNKYLIELMNQKGISNIKTYSPIEYGRPGTKDYSTWSITRDISLAKEKDFQLDQPIEIVSPRMNSKEFFETIPQIFDIINKVGYTKDIAGFHVGLSHKNLDHSKLNKEALVSSLEDPRILKTMPGRGSVDVRKYAKSSEEILRQTGKLTSAQESKKFSVNIRPDYVEFRMLGGKDYQKNFQEIRKIILNYMVNYKKSITDPEFQKKKLAVMGSRAESKKQSEFEKMKQNPEGQSQLIYFHIKDFDKWFDPETFPFSDQSKVNELIQSVGFMVGEKSFSGQFKAKDIMKKIMTSAKNMNTVISALNQSDEGIISALIDYSTINGLELNTLKALEQGLRGYPEVHQIVSDVLNRKRGARPQPAIIQRPQRVPRTVSQPARSLPGVLSAA